MRHYSGGQDEVQDDCCYMTSTLGALRSDSEGHVTT